MNQTKRFAPDLVDRKLALRFGAVVLVLILTAVGVASYLFAQHQTLEEDRLAHTIAVVLAESASRVNFSGKHHTRMFVEETLLQAPELAYISIEDRNGRIIAHSDPSKNDQTVNPESVEQIKRALAKFEPDVRERWIDGLPVKETLAPFSEGFDQETKGVLRIGVRVAETRRAQFSTLYHLLLLVACLTGAAMLVVYQLSRRVGAQVRALAGQLQGILDHAPLGVAIEDRHGRILAQGVEFRRLVGAGEAPAKKTESESLRQALSRRLPEEASNAFGTMDREVLEEGAYIERVLDFGPAFARIHWRLAMFPIGKDETGAATGACLLVTDVTARKRAEEALFESEARYRTLVENIPGAAYRREIEPPCPFVHVSSGVAALTGRPREAFLKRTFFFCEITFEEDIAKIQQEVARCIERRTPYHLEYRIRHAKGETRWIGEMGRALYDEQGKPLFLDGVMLDVTAAKEAELALRESENKFRTFFERSPIGLVLLDKRHCVLDCNKAFAELFGSRRENYLGLNLLEAMLEPRVKEAFLDCIKNGEGWYEGPYASFLTGKQLTLRLRTAIVDQRLLLGMLEDFTERKASEDALRRAKEAAEAGAKAKTEFLANMSHEIRTPLNGVLGMLQLLGRTSLDQKQTLFVETALSAGGSLLRIISDILDLSKIESGKFDVEERNFDLLDVFQVVTTAFHEQLASKNIALSHVIEPGAPTLLLGDELRLRQILFNLVGNSVKFTDAGSISLSASCLEKSDISDLTRLKFVIADTGVGIPKNKLAAIFEPFTQADGSYTRRHQGAGLGLAIVKRLIGLLGGELHIESEPGKGTSVSFELPLRRRREQPSALAVSARRISSPTRSGQRVLVVEDEAVNRLAAKMMLDELGCATTLAVDGAEAMKHCETIRFDLVLMDVQMPVLDGLQTTARLREFETRKGLSPTPIVAMTAHAMQGDRERFLAAGMDEYLSKPIQYEQLEEVLSRFSA
jgi:PAS domain S-box-containing protein